MNKINVSELTDVELNRAMIWLYHTKGLWTDPDTGTPYCSDIGDAYQVYFLDKWDLTMPLAVENKVWLQPDCMGNGFIHAYDDDYSAKAINPLRAICEVLVMIKLEKLNV